MTVTANRFFGFPHTRLGWCSIGLAIVFLILFFLFINATVPVSYEKTLPQPVLLPNLGCITLLLGLGASIVSLLSITRQQERSWLVWFSLLPGIFVILLLISDLLNAILKR